MSDSIAILLAHVTETLPDSLSKRKKVLTALLNVMKAKHPAYRSVQAQLAAIDTIERLQSDLPLLWSKSGSAVPQHDGDGQGKS